MGIKVISLIYSQISQCLQRFASLTLLSFSQFIILVILQVKQQKTGTLKSKSASYFLEKTFEPTKEKRRKPNAGTTLTVQFSFPC